MTEIVIKFIFPPLTNTTLDEIFEAAFFRHWQTARVCDPCEKRNKQGELHIYPGSLSWGPCQVTTHGKRAHTENSCLAGQRK